MSCWQAFSCAGAAVAGAALAALSAWGVMRTEPAGLRFAHLPARPVAAIPGALYETTAEGAGAPLCVIESARAAGAATETALRAGVAAGGGAGAGVARLDGARPGARPDAARTLRLDAALRLGPACVARVREAWARGRVVCLVERVLFDGGDPVAVGFHRLALRPPGEASAALCPLHGAERVPWGAVAAAPR